MKNYLLSFVTPVVMWALMGDKDVMTTFPVAVVLALGMIALAPKKGFIAFFYALLVAVAGYWVLGPIGVVAAVCIAVLGFVDSDRKLGSSLALLIVTIVGLLFMSAGFHVLPYPVQRIVRGIDYYRDPMACIPCEWYTSDVYEQLEYSMLVRKKDWKGILAKAAGAYPDAMSSLAAVKLAQWKTGRISNEDIREFIAVYQKLDNPINICMKSDVFFHLYMVNASRRYAFEFKQLIGNNNQSGRIIKRLAETELVSGHYQLARKYLYILRDAPFYRQWAEETLPLTYDRKLLEAHPVYGVLSMSFPEKDHLS